MIKPLEGINIIEMRGLGPTPFCGMMLADMGANVTQVLRGSSFDTTLERGRTMVEIDLKTPEGVEQVLAMCAEADGLIEGYRPGVMERLGLGPDDVKQRNPAIVYGRITGFGQNGPYANKGSHDINFMSLSGLLNYIQDDDGAPIYPVVSLGDFGGCGMVAAFAMVCGLLNASKTGQGSVIDINAAEGCLTLMALHYFLNTMGGVEHSFLGDLMSRKMPHYNVYQCADEKYISFGALELKFQQQLLHTLELDKEELFSTLEDRERWPEQVEQLKKIFVNKPRNHWIELFENVDACFTPVNSMEDALNDPHYQARESFVEIDGVKQPAPTPRFKRI